MWPTKAQMEARIRNNRIRMLRCMYANARNHLSHDRRGVVLNAIDEELTFLDARPESELRAEDRAADLEGRGYYKGYGKRRKFVEYPEVAPNAQR